MAKFVEITVEGPSTRRQFKDIEVIDPDEEDYANALIGQFCTDLEKKIQARRRLKQYYADYEEQSSSTGIAKDERSHTPS